jgi:hypothetical protein
MIQKCCAGGEHTLERIPVCNRAAWQCWDQMGATARARWVSIATEPLFIDVAVATVADCD